MAATALWQGFDFAWRQRPHRLRLFGSVLDELEADAAGVVHGRHVSRCGVGSIGDTADAYTYVAPVGARALGAVHGLHTARLSGATGEECAIGPRRIEVPLLMARDEVAVATPVIRGFSLSATLGVGIDTRGFGFELRDPQLSGNTLSFEPTFVLYPADAADPRHRAAPPSTYDMTLFYSVLFARRGEAHFATDAGAAPAVSVRHHGPGAAPLQTRTTLAGVSGGAFGRAAVGIRGFRWRVLDAPRAHATRRRLARLLTFVRGVRYAPASGAAVVTSNVMFSDRVGTAVAPAVRAEHELALTLVQYNDAGPASVGVALHNVIDATPSHGVHAARFALPPVVAPGAGRKATR